jgi:hypothetical protein
MIFRRIKAHIAKEDWFAVFIDFIIVVFGVFMGFQVQAWNEGLKDSERERGYLERLHEDFITSIDGLQSDNDFLKGQLANEAIIISSLEACAVKAEDLDAFQFGINQLGYINAVRFYRRTIDELMASGEMDIIKNKKLKETLANITAGVESRINVTESVLRIVEHHRFIVEEEIRYDVDLPISNNALAVIFDIKQLCADPKVISAVSAVSQATFDHLGAHSVLLEDIEKFPPMLEEELHNRWGVDISESEPTQ